MSEAIRGRRGATISLVVVCSLVMAMLVFAFFQFAMIFGGSNELRNAVDAGALNIGREAVQADSLKTTPASGDEHQFDDCLDSGGKISLMNINRVWGKAFLINANVEAMDSAGSGEGSTSSSTHGSTIFEAAQKINDRLFAILNDQSKIHPYFEKILKQNSIRMLGQKASMETLADDAWKTSLVDRDSESNITIELNQLPGGYSGLSAADTKLLDAASYIRGYRGLKANGKNFSLIPFKHKEKPHLISGKYFTDNTLAKSPFPTWTNPIPNAVSAHAKSTNQTYYQNDATAYVVANPQRQYKLSLAHAFIRIKLDGNDASWYVNGIPAASSTYGYFPEVQNKVIAFDIGSGTLTGFASLGNEYIPPTLGKAIYALPGDHGQVTTKLLQRVREIKPGFSEGNLTALLNAQPLLPGVDEYLIYPVYTTADNTDPTIMCQPAKIAAASCSWLSSGATPDGSEKKIADEAAAAFTAPNQCWETVAGTGCKPGPFWTTMQGWLYWTAGSGYDQCLGQLRIKRKTSIYLNGACTVL